MNNIFQLTSIAALMGISGLVHAGLTTSSGVENFNGSASVGATATRQLSASNNNNNASVATVSLGQFDGSLGVLTGVELQLNSSRTQSVDGTGYKYNGAGKTASGSGTSTAALSASGFSAAFAPAIAQSGSGCGLAMGMTGYISCGWGPEASTATATNTTASVDSNNLNDYVGNGSVDASLTTPSLSATATLSTTMGQESGSTVNYSVSWQGSLEAVYSYLLHASASFDGSASQNSLTLDFGTVLQNSAASSLNFNIFNLSDVNRTGLDLDGFSRSGDTNIFNTSLAGFTDLAQGGSNGFIASMLTENLGAFSASYLLDLSDADFGASSTWKNQTLTLNLVGEVVPVPVPAAVWLFGSALIGLIGSRRAGQAV